MTSSSDRSSSSVFSTPSAGRRILHRFASPFGPKARSIAEFTVRAHDPHKQYAPGEAVSGAVIVKVVKPIRLTHISVCLHGFVQVHKNPGDPSEPVRGYGARIGRSQGKKSGEYFGNGFASLFEDETVLCGDGRLDSGTYQFDFEVVFPKDIDLPSSIEFERGTISYLITASLTRPTTMNPIISHEQRLYLCERIDIASLLPPKPRTITLEPVLKRSRQRGQARRIATDSQGRTGTPSVSTRTRDSAATASTPNLAFDANVPRTPSVSELSIDSRVSSNLGRLSVSGSAYQSQRTSDSLTGTDSTGIEKTITATVESLKGGCLRGDSLPVRIAINHTKAIKSMNGVIITLYRLARVDMHPALPLGPTTEGQKKKYEDYYPKSLTGLGGLSLSGAGSSHVFRKDLAQTLVPLIIDPQALKTDINAKVNIPDDAFPTINTVPGSMISFRYYIEVVLDIQGKLGGNEKFFAQRGGTYGAGLGTPLSLPGFSGIEMSSPSGLHGTVILDTAPIRREKSVVTCIFEVVIGTLDSDRKKGRAKAQTPSNEENMVDTSHVQPTSIDQTPLQHQLDQSGAQHQTQVTPSSQVWRAEPGYGHSSNGYDGYFEYDGYDGYENTGYPDYYSYENTGHYDYNSYYDAHQTAPPPVDDEDTLPEKERLRRAEARLMPSEPPDAAEISALDSAGPSAPVIPQDYPYHHVSGAAIPGTSVNLHPTTLGETDSERAYLSYDADDRLRGSALVPLSESSQAASGAQLDDKQELQRQQLQHAVSGPPGGIHMDGGWVVGAQPSAPAESDVDTQALTPLHEHGYEHKRVEHLPKYQR